MNDATAALVARRRDRLTGLAVINPFGADADLAELRRAVVGLGLRGVAVGASYRGQPLDAPAARPYLAQVETLGIPLVIHPTVDGAVTTARDFGLDLLLGVPADLALCAIRLIVSGRLAEFPRLCVVLAHAGGGFLSLLGWLDAHAATESLRPLEQAKRFYVDLATASAGDLALALSIVGPDHILYATDWPIAPPVAPGDPQRDIAALPLSLDERGAILAGNARRLFG
jgi:predicted TIM-barrel fold metal-dependent hydrolase